MIINTIDDLCLQSITYSYSYSVRDDHYGNIFPVLLMKNPNRTKPHVYRTRTEHEPIFTSTQNTNRTEPLSSKNPNWTQPKIFFIYELQPTTKSCSPWAGIQSASEHVLAADARVPRRWSSSPAQASGPAPSSPPSLAPVPTYNTADARRTFRTHSKVRCQPIPYFGWAVRTASGL